MEDAQAQQVMARIDAARKPPTDKNIGHDIYRTEKQILLMLPAV